MGQIRRLAWFVALVVGFVPEIHAQTLQNVADGTANSLPMDTDEAWDISERLAKEEGMLVGHSSGASLAGGVRIAKRLAAAGKQGVIVTLFPDRAERYFEAPQEKLK